MPTIERKIVNLSAAVSIAKKNDTEPRFSMLAYTGKPIDSWWGAFVIDLSGIETKEKTPVLMNHDYGAIVGWSDEVVKDAGGLLFSGVFSQLTEEGKKVVSLADEGFPWQASIGVKPLSIRFLKSAEETEIINGVPLSGPMEIWTKSHVGEVSVTPWGIDSDTSMTRLSESGKVSVEIEPNEKGDKEMPMNLLELKEKHPDLYREVFELGAISVDIQKIRDEAIGAERSRVVAILSEKADPEATVNAIKDGTSVDGAYKLFYQAEKAKRATELSALEASGNNALGHQSPVDPPKKIDDPSAEVSRRAVEMSIKDKITLAEATQLVLSQDKDLSEKYRQQFNV